MGDGIWYFMWCVDRTTKEVADGTGDAYGIVLGGMPCHDQDVASSFGVHVNTIRTWRIRLTKEKYIKTTRTPNGYSLKVLKSKKWPKRLTETCDSQKTVNHSSLLLDSQNSGLDPQNPGLDSQQTANAIRQDRDSTKTEQKNEPPKTTSPSFEEIKKKLFENYTKRFPGQKMVWRKAENNALEVLIQDRAPRDIVIAHRSYLEIEDAWERKHGFPFCSFAKKVSQYLVAQSDDDDDNEPYYPPGYTPPSKKAPVE